MRLVYNIPKEMKKDEFYVLTVTDGITQSIFIEVKNRIIINSNINITEVDIPLSFQSQRNFMRRIWLKYVNLKEET